MSPYIVRNVRIGIGREKNVSEDDHLKNIYKINSKTSKQIFQLHGQPTKLTAFLKISNKHLIK